MENTLKKSHPNPTSVDDTLKKIPFTIKLGDARWPSRIYDIPDAVKVMSMRMSPRRDSSGNVIDGTVGKITFEVTNFKILQMVIKNGGSESDLSTITLDYVTDEATMKSYKPEDLIGKILDIRQAEVGLKWVQRGGSGSWGGFKLICSTLKFVQLPTNQATE